jgi:hypothetical protein
MLDQWPAGFAPQFGIVWPLPWPWLSLQAEVESMRSTLNLVADVVLLIHVASRSNDWATRSPGEVNRSSATEYKSDGAERVDAAGRTPDNAGKCFAGACADSSPPTSP